MSRPQRPLLMLLAVALAAVASAAPSPDTFNVELVVFRYNGTVASPEDWEVAVPAAAANDPDAASADAATTPDAIHPLNAAQFQLNGTESALRRNSSYEPLTHVGYRVTTTERDSGTPVRIDALAGATNGISGTITLQRGRFLHLALDLTYTTPSPPAKLLAPNTAPGPLSFHLRQDRRMKPFERHYFDHPAFGVVAIITPVAGAD